MLETIDLGGAWTLRFGQQMAGAPATPEQLAGSQWPTIPARVPGNVELDLMEAGLLPRELHRGNRIYQLRPFEFYRWWYGRSFTTPQTPAGHRIVLVLEGVDCIADLYLDGQRIGSCRNMLIEHRFDITDHLQAGKEHQLAIRIDSSVLEGRKHQADAVEHASLVAGESLAVRKAPHMYGWDILPRVVSAGLWRPVKLEIQPPTRIENVYWATLSADAAQRKAQVQVSWHIATDVADIDGWKMYVRLYRGGRCFHESLHPVMGAHGRALLNLADVDLWWPRGSGPVALHNAGLQLVDAGGNKLSEHHIRLGIRTAELRRTDVTDHRGEGEFVFVVNGRKIFCRGTNHVPLDALHSRDPEHLRRVLDMLVELNCNMVRCWGGNVYEDHAFFDECDKRGIMVWQDFAMACAIYPQTAAFAQEIRTEAEAVVRKLRNHCSLVLWAGNNEIDEAYGWSNSGIDPNTDIHSRQVLPEVVRRLDPHRGYLPSSPYYSPQLIRSGNIHAQCPETHLWGPRDDFKGPFYASANAHFVSEIGYHGCPNRAAMEAMMDSDALWPWQGNEQWLTHCVRPHPNHHAYDYRIELMAKQIRVLFDRDPENLDDFIFASQASQAEALKYFIERWRIGKWRRTGMLWWNLRDGWPAISDAIVDYFGGRKLAYEVVRRIQADVCVSVAEPQNGVHDVMVLNDSQSAAPLHVCIRDIEGGQVLFEGDVCGKADASTKVGQVPPAGKAAMYAIQWQGEQQRGINHYLAGPRPFVLGDYRRWSDALATMAK